MNTTIFTLALICVIALIVLKASRKQPDTREGKQDEALDIQHGYQKRWLLSVNEKYAYDKLKPITDQLGLTLFTKVRLYDLVEPRRGAKKYKTLQYKIQAKHVDFVICNQTLTATHVIELDDSSHDAQSRRERDQFVDEVLRSTGYKVLHIRGVDPEAVTAFLST